MHDFLTARLPTKLHGQEKFRIPRNYICKTWFRVPVSLTLEWIFDLLIDMYPAEVKSLNPWSI